MGHARQQIVGRFVEHGATMPDRAIAFAADGREAERLLRRLRRHGVVAEAMPGQFWLDADRLGSFRGAVRRRAVAWAGASGMAVVAAAAFALVE